MLTNIFAEQAPRYYAKGLPVIPLRPMEKKPIPAAWSQYSDNLPTADEQAAWIASKPNANMGIVLGKQSDLVMVDIDTDDPTIMGVIQDILAPFPSPWKRIGKKGMAIAYRQPIGAGPLKTFRLVDATTKKTLVECLSTGTQLVLPPSIHPDTKRPYVANADLIEVYDLIPRLPADLEGHLRAAFEKMGIKLSLSGMGGVIEFVSSGNRDNKMIKMAGYLAWGVTRGELTLLEAIGRIETWAESFVEKVAGDNVDVRKGVQSLCGFLVRDVMVGKKTLPKGWDEGLTPELKKGLGLSFEHEFEEWGYEEILSYIRLEHEKYGSDSEGWINTMTYVLERLARSKSLDQLAVENVLRYIATVGGSKVTIATLRARLKEFKQGDVKGQDHTEIAQKVLEEIEQYGELRWHQSKFWQWTGSHWEPKDEDEMLRIIANSYGNLAAAKRRSDHVGIMKTMASLKAMDLQTVTMSGINFANGYLTDDLKLKMHDKEYGCTYTLPYRYLPELADKCPRFIAFLDRSFIGDEDAEQKKMAIQEAIAATLFGKGTEFFRVILLFGPAHTGKTELLKMVEALVPDEVKSALPPDQWGEKFGPAQLVGKLLNMAGELSGSKRIDGQIFKMITEGASMSAQYKGMQLFKFNPTATHWFGSNHTPRTEDTSGGFLRRWMLIRFEHPITKEEKVPNIAMNIIMEEREAIVAWAAQAMPRLLKQKEYSLPKSHWTWINEVANNNNSVRHFIRESGLVRIVSAPGTGQESSTSTHVTETKLYDAYAAFCLIGGAARRVGQRQFKMQMADLAGELGFLIRTESEDSGLIVTRYINLTFADARMAA